MSSDSSGEFHRIRRLPPYVFAEVNSAKARARAAGEDIIDLGMGNPDSATPPHIVAAMVKAVQDPKTHRYSSSQGIPGLRKALAGYYERRFGVSLNPDKEVIATLGSKEGLANLASAITSRRLGVPLATSQMRSVSAVSLVKTKASRPSSTL